MKSHLHMCFSLLVLALVSLPPQIGAVNEVMAPWPIIEVPIDEPVEIKQVLNQTDFWFRDDDGTETSASGYGSPDAGEDTVIASVAAGTVFRLRFGVRGTILAGTVVPRLEFKQGTGCAVGDWATITPAGDVFGLRSSGNFSDGDPTTKQITNGSFVAGQILESTNPASSLNLPRNKNTEYEWSLQAASNAVTGATYSFRLTNNGTVFGGYDQCPSLTIQSEPEEPEPTPAGGGDGGKVRPTTVTFSGEAFPGAKILVVDKDIIRASEKIVSQHFVADEEGKFSLSFIGIMQSQHSFGLLVKDRDNRTAQTKFFDVNTLTNDLATKDILMPPTVGFLQRLVSRGQSAIVVGNASPSNNIILEVDDAIKKEAEVEKDGSYQAAIDTGTLEFGTHRVRVKQVDAEQNRESDYSLTNVFTVSRLVSPKTDLSGDGVVDVRDWSIFLAGWGAKDESRKKTIDFNDDGKTDISDFSIFIRAIKK